jgi:hypothetical protein
MKRPSFQDATFDQQQLPMLENKTIFWLGHYLHTPMHPLFPKSISTHHTPLDRLYTPKGPMINFAYILRSDTVCVLHYRFNREKRRSCYLYNGSVYGSIAKRY